MRPEQHTFPLFAYLILIIALGAAPGVLAQDNPLGLSSDEQKEGEKQRRLEQVDPLDSLQKRLEMQRETELPPLLEPDNEIKIKLLENRLTLENIPEDGVLEIYNIMGVKVYSRCVRAGIAGDSYRSTGLLHHKNW